jgi:hypothetical protein
VHRGGQHAVPPPTIPPPGSAQKAGDSESSRGVARPTLSPTHAREGQPIEEA